MHVKSGMHHATTLDTTDSEMYEVSMGVAGPIALCFFMADFGFPQERASEAKCDNLGACKSAASDKAGLHISWRMRYCNEARWTNQVAMVRLATEMNRADVLTKAISNKAFMKLCDMILNVRNAAVNIHAVVKARWLG